MSEIIAEYDRISIDCAEVNLIIESVDYLRHSVASRPLLPEPLAVESFAQDAAINRSNIGHHYDPETGHTIMNAELVINELGDEHMTPYILFNTVYEYLIVEAEIDDYRLDFWTDNDQQRHLDVYMENGVKVTISYSEKTPKQPSKFILTSKFENDGMENDDAYCSTVDVLQAWALLHSSMLWMNEQDEGPPADYRLTVHSYSQNAQSHMLFQSLLDVEHWATDMGITDLPKVDYNSIDFHGIGQELAARGLSSYKELFGAVRALTLITRGCDNDGNRRTLDGEYVRSAVLGKL